MSTRPSGRCRRRCNLYDIVQLAQPVQQAVLEVVPVSRAIVVGAFLVVGSRIGEQAMDHSQYAVAQRHTGALASSSNGGEKRGGEKRGGEKRGQVRFCPLKKT